MANAWLRLWHDMPNDPKWRTIAREAKQPLTAVIGVYLHVLVDASANADERGRTKSINSEDVASALDIETVQVEAILSAMQGRVLDGDRVTGWEKRQPLREDGSAERSKSWREAEKERKRTQANAEKRPDTDTDTDKERSKPSTSPAPAKEKPEAATPIGFAEFWGAYPKKVGKGAAERAWRKARINGQLPELLQAIDRQKRSEQWLRDGGQYIPNPATWINEHRWHDELPMASGPPARASPRMNARDAGRLSAARTIFGTDIEASPHGIAEADRTIDITPAAAGTLGIENLCRDAG